MGIEDKEDLKDMAVFWVFGTIIYLALTLKIYNSWFVKVIYNNNDLENLRDNLQAWKILGKKWSNKTNVKFLNFESTKSHIKNLIKILNDKDEWEWIDRLCNSGVLFFIYNRIANANKNLGYDWEKIQKSRYVVVKFTTYAINFCSKKNSNRTFNINFQMQSIYLINREKQQVLYPSKKKCGPDKWLILPSRTSKLNVHVNLLE